MAGYTRFPSSQHHKRKPVLIDVLVLHIALDFAQDEKWKTRTSRVIAQVERKVDQQGKEIEQQGKHMKQQGKDIAVCLLQLEKILSRLPRSAVRARLLPCCNSCVPNDEWLACLILPLNCPRDC